MEYKLDRCFFAKKEPNYTIAKPVKFCNTIPTVLISLYSFYIIKPFFYNCSVSLQMIDNLARNGVYPKLYWGASTTPLYLYNCLMSCNAGRISTVRHVTGTPDMVNDSRVLPSDILCYFCCFIFRPVSSATEATPTP